MAAQMRITATLGTRLLFWTTFSIMFAVTYKDDAAAFATSKWLSDYQQPAYVLLLKQISIAALALPPVAIIVLSLSKPVLNPTGFWATKTLAVLWLWELARLASSENLYAFQILAGGAIFIAFLLAFMLTARVGRASDAAQTVLHAMAALCLIHVIINLSTIVAGHGFHNSRFIGTTIQPNFIGVQMAISTLLLWSQTGFKGWTRPIYLAGAVTAAILLILSGSRTGVALLAVAITTYLMLRGINKKFLIPVLFAAVATVAVASLSFPSDIELGQYDRGGQNTREEAWSSLSLIIQSAPIAGQGELPLASESSYLRGWATVGLPFPILFLGALAVLSVQIAQGMMRRQNVRVIAAFGGCAMGCLFGGVFEGYLIDSFTFTLFAFLFSLVGFEAAIKPIPASKR